MYAAKYTPTAQSEANHIYEGLDENEENPGVPPFRLVQVAVHYSETVIQKMVVKYPPSGEGFISFDNVAPITRIGEPVETTQGKTSCVVPFNVC